MIQEGIGKIKLLLRISDTFWVFLNIGVNWNGIKQARANRVRIKNALSLVFHFLYYRVQSILYNRVNTLSSNMLLFSHKSTLTLLVILSANFPKWQNMWVVHQTCLSAICWVFSGYANNRGKNHTAAGNFNGGSFHFN